jgi:hypothetical protein
MALKFNVHDVLTDKYLGSIDPVSYSFNDPINGNGQFTGAVTIPHDPGPVATLKARTLPDAVALYILDGNTYIWGGIINYRDRKPGVNVLNIQAQHWRAWYFDRLISAKAGYFYSNQDWWTIARSLMNLAQTEGGGPAGCPSISYDTTAVFGTSGDLTMTPGMSIGSAMDDIANRDNGFEWSVAFRNNTQTGLPQRFLELWVKGQTRSGVKLLSLDANQSTNRVMFGQWAESAVNRRSRVWAVGAGQPPDQPVAPDTDPDTAAGKTLLRETWETRQGVVNTSTLFAYARWRRIKLENPYAVVPVEIPFGVPPIASYRSGDRVRVRIEDSWDDLDIPGVRLTNRTVHMQQGQAPSVTLEIDFNDISEVL